jgi:hypothetical protein
MKEDDYTFVTIDETDSSFDGAVVIDIDNDFYMDGAVTIDDNMDNADFITMSDDTVMLDIDCGSFDSGDFCDLDMGVL